MDDKFFVKRGDGIADSLFVERWSPKSFLPVNIPNDHLKKIIDAARWSPSTNNEQPWVFYTVARNARKFENSLECLNETNKAWAKNSSVIGFLIANKFFKTKERENKLCDFDCGAAWMALTIQSRMLGYYTHGMGGIFRDKVSEFLKLEPSKHKVVMGFVVGKRGVPVLSSDETTEKENASPRESLETIWKEL